ncbi:TIGR00730 family Rossman fold protein [Patescibacteria group bacterium]|nr:TIGR00730 family Rossman fold protein [Patescibacteria group bacterium]
MKKTTLTIEPIYKSFRLTREKPIEIIKLHSGEIESWRIFKIMAEFVSGFEFISKYKAAVSVFGSARCTIKDSSYREAESLGAKLANMGFAVVTGGGPGIMEAVNKGASDAGGQSAGLNIRLGGGATEVRNQYVRQSMTFDYFFVRKVMLSFVSQVYVYFPGGFGTMDEFFELVTLIQTKKIKPIPVILVGKEYWTPLLFWIENTVCKDYAAISKKDMKLYCLVDNADEAVKLIKKLIKK